MKYKTIFISATNTDIGKTFTSIKIIKELGRRGLKVGVLKPIETGVKEIPLDGRLLFEEAKKTNEAIKDFTFDDIVPIQYPLPAAPYVSKKREKIDFEIIQKAYKKIAGASDIVIVEGAGGLLVPIEKEFYMYDMIKFFDAKVLLVTHANLGCINDTLLNLYFLKSKNINFSWCVNIKENRSSYEKITLPFYQDNFGKVLTIQDDLKEIVDNLLVRNRVD